MTDALPPLRWAASAVVDPDRETARQWAVEELARPEYQQGEANLVVRGLVWLIDEVRRLLDAATLAGNAGGLVVAVLVVAAVVVLALLLAGPLARARRPADAAGDLYGGTVRTAAEHRDAAERAAAEGRWRTAVQERFRAVARQLEERVVLDVRPGRTADEVAAEAGALLAGTAAALEAAARDFDDVTYGERDGDRAAYERCVAADDAVRTARPPARGATVDAAVPL